MVGYSNVSHLYLAKLFAAVNTVVAPRCSRPCAQVDLSVSWVWPLLRQAFFRDLYHDNEQTKPLAINLVLKESAGFLIRVVLLGNTLQKMLLIGYSFDNEGGRSQHELQISSRKN